MLILVCVTMTLLALGLLVAASFAGVFFAQNRLQTSADEIALAGARKLNESNRLGQMNDLIARSRQLVFSINQQNNEVRGAGNNPLLEKFAQQLTKEAMDSAAALDKERHDLADLAQGEAKDVMQKKFDQVKDSYAMALPWLTVQTPQVVSVDTGMILGTPSNARELQGFKELIDQDKVKDHVFKGKPVNLYRAENDATLQLPDSPHFRFSPLAAPVVNDPAPARAALPETFAIIKGDYAPCATKLELSLKVSTGLGPHGEGVFKVGSAAAATGGALFQ